MRVHLLVLLVAIALSAAVPGSAAQFTDLATTLNIPGAVGAAWGDYDEDGYPDLALTSVPSGHWPMLLHNNGDLTFTDVSSAMGFPSTADEQDGAAWADYDNDGDIDLIVACGSGSVKLYRNDGDGFVDVAVEAGLSVANGPGRGVAWCDYNADGWLDVFICNTMANVSHLMRNNGDGTFTDANTEAGMTGLAIPSAGNAAAWADFDNDGYADLLLSRMGARPLLFRNDGDGTFTEVGMAAGLSGAVDTFGVAWADYDNDGWLDCYLGSATGVLDWLFHNNGDGTFTDVAATAGMAADDHVGVGVAWADYDSDGWVDLYVGNIDTYNQAFLYRNTGSGTFLDVAASSGVGGSRPNEAAAWADMDLDGRMDLFSGVGGPLSALFHNVGPAGNWLRVRALTSESGDATGTDPVRDAIGAVVSLSLDNAETIPTGAAGTLTRVIDGGSGFCAQNEQIAQFGLGSASTVSVRARFPDGSAVIHRGVAANQQITIKDVPADYTETFTDVPLDYWAYPQVRAAYAAGIVKGSGGSYFPTDTVTRDQLAVYIARAMNGADLTGSATVPFVDITNPWANVYIAYCIDHGVVKGFDATHYGPALEVDRGSMAVFIARAKGWVSIDDAMNTAPELFADVPAGYWSGTAVQACVDHGVVNGYDATHFQPTWIVSRDQMAVFVARAFNLPM